MVLSRALAVSTHGRYLVEPSHVEPAPLLVGFHGYAEDAETQLARLQGIPGADRWLLVSIQGLHRFYRGRGHDRSVVASWMTRQDRDLLIADNVAYVAAVVDAARREQRTSPTVVFAGFSQGVAMAFRAACSAQRHLAGLIGTGGDVPPELNAEMLARIPVALVGRGRRDDLYAADHWAADQGRLRAAGVSVHATAFDGGHEWTSEFSEAAAQFLARVLVTSGSGPGASIRP